MNFAKKKIIQLYAEEPRGGEIFCWRSLSFRFLCLLILLLKFQNFARTCRVTVVQRSRNHVRPYIRFIDNLRNKTDFIRHAHTHTHNHFNLSGVTIAFIAYYVIYDCNCVSSLRRTYLLGASMLVIMHCVHYTNENYVRVHTLMDSVCVFALFFRVMCSVTKFPL